MVKVKTDPGQLFLLVKVKPKPCQPFSIGYKVMRDPDEHFQLVKVKHPGQMFSISQALGRQPGQLLIWPTHPGHPFVGQVENILHGQSFSISKYQDRPKSS